MQRSPEVVMFDKIHLERTPTASSWSMAFKLDAREER
jgi:hypothetical protein